MRMIMIITFNVIMMMVMLIPTYQIIWLKSNSKYLMLIPSAMHCGNLARLSSFLNRGTITSSTRAQNCSDHDNDDYLLWWWCSDDDSGCGSWTVRGVPRIGKWSQRVSKSCSFGRKERQIGPSASFSFVEEDKYNHQESSGGCPHKSYGWAALVPWCSLGSASPISWRSTHPCSWSSEESPEKTSHVFSSNFCDQWSVNKGVCTDIFNKQSCV